MRRKTIARLLPLAVSTLASTTASAAGFQLLEQNAGGIGNAFAGSAAAADDASTIYFNPAGMTQLRDREISVGLAVVRPRFRFKDQGSSAGTLSGNGKDAGTWLAVPNMFLSWALSKDVYVGLGLTKPYGLDLDYGESWVGGAQATRFEANVYNLNPSVAYRVTDTISLGAGFNWQRMDVKYTRLVGTRDFTFAEIEQFVPLLQLLPSVPLSTSTATLKVDSDSWGWNLGALVKLSPTTRVGVSYRSKVKHKLEGDLKVSGLGPVVDSRNSSKAKTDVELPDAFIASVAQELNERWEVLGDVSWTAWSTIDTVNIVRTSGPDDGQTVQTLDPRFRDTWRVALGTNYKLNDAWKLRFGLAYDQTPVKDKEHRLVILPDNNRTWFSIGGQWKPTKSSALDIGLAYLYLPKTQIDSDQTNLLNPTQDRGRVTGEFDASVWVFGLQYSTAF